MLYSDVRGLVMSLLNATVVAGRDGCDDIVVGVDGTCVGVDVVLRH